MESGNFDVLVNHRLVHCKSNGDGFLDDDDKLDKVFAAITASLDGTGAQYSETEATEYRKSVEDKRSFSRSISHDRAADAVDKPLLKSAADRAVENAEKDDKAGRRSLCVSMFTLIISIPALIGA